MKDTFQIQFSDAEQTAQGLLQDAQVLYDTLGRTQTSMNRLLSSGLQGSFLDDVQSRFNIIESTLRHVADETDEAGHDLQTVIEWARQLNSESASRLGTSDSDGSIIAGLIIGGFIFAGIGLLAPVPVIAPGLHNRGNNVIGDPDDLLQYYQVQSGPVCGFQATQNILRAAGIDVSLTDLKAQAGYDDPNYDEGTYYDDYTEMLTANNVAVDSYESFETDQDAVDNLLNDLESGKGVLARIDVTPLDSYWGGNGGGHALWITGVRQDENGNITHIVCNDSGLNNDANQNGTWNDSTGLMNEGGDGLPDGRGVEYPVDEFLEAWEMREYSYVATQQSLDDIVI
jgi:hypothetical protein